MAVKRTQKQMFLDLEKGIPTDYLLQYGYGPNPYTKRPLLNSWIGPSILMGTMGPEGGENIFGVKYVSSRSTGYASLPEPNNFILDDITKWREVIKVPDLSHVDWEKEARKDMALTKEMGADPDETLMVFMSGAGCFQHLMAFMGFTEGLCAISEEPEEVKALVDYLTDFYLDVYEKCFDYYPVDIFGMADDNAAWGAPFISLEQYRQIFKPAQAREAQFAKDKGLSIIMHDCGKCEMFIDDWIEMGIHYWEPAQTCNDLVGIQKKYGKEMIVVGGVDMPGKLLLPDSSEEEFKKYLMDVIDRYSVEGFYVLAGWVFADPENKTVANRNKLMTEVVEDYGEKLYRNTMQKA